MGKEGAAHPAVYSQNLLSRHDKLSGSGIDLLERNAVWEQTARQRKIARRSRTGANVKLKQLHRVGYITAAGFMHPLLG